VQSDTKRIVLDCHGLQFLDSSGIGVLVAARARLLQSGGSISVRCLDGVISRVISLSGLDEVLDVVVEPTG